jgi:hypothetical protein
VNSDFTRTFDAIDKTKIDFKDFQELIDRIIERTDLGPTSLLFNSQAYNLLRFAVESFVRIKLNFPDETVVLPGASSPGILPQYEFILNQLNEFLPAVTDRDKQNPDFRTRLTGNRTELIWNYWHEEGMVVQTMNAIAFRFLNKCTGETDPLANFELDSLRPLANILFGYIQDSPHRLTINRRNYEYMYEYGIKLNGKAVPAARVVNARSNFIEAFHNLLYRCIEFYKLVDDRTKSADPFPVLNSLQEVNLQLMEGMHNQYNDLSLTSRVEMMLEQWILSRKEIQEFLRGKPMVLYHEPWMGAVDTMKNIQGWTTTSVSYYHDLARFGEDIILSIRFVPWNTLGTTQDARVWAIRNREAVQRYIHNYQAVTGVDVSANTVNSLENGKYQMPSLLLQKKYQREKIMNR